jgi:hypothetical protein
MDFEDFTVAKEPEKQSALQQIKKLDEERAKLLESAKGDALARAEEAINELISLGFEYELIEYGAKEKTKPRKVGARKPIDHTPKGMCPICEYATNPPHDKRSHRAQTKKKPFTDAELEQRSMKRA